MTTQGLFPEFVDRCRERIRRGPFKSLFVGLAGAVPGVTLGVALFRAPSPAAKFIGATLLLLLVLIGLMGSAGLAAQVGMGLGAFADGRSSWRCVWRGGLVLGLTFILPLIGWLIILPGTLIIGLGATLRSFRRARTTRESAVFDPHLAATQR